MPSIKNHLLLCGLVLLHSLLMSQQHARLPGLVVEQNSQFNTGTVKYLSGAEVKAEGNRTHSDAQGRFTLVFADRPPGEVVWVHAAKNGYELVNAEELRKAAVTGRSPLNPLKVVLCPEGRLYENQMAYYRIARDAKLESYRRRMAVLEKEGREKEALLLQMARDFNVQHLGDDSARILLQAQLQAAQQQARELAERFVTVNLDDQGETYQRAFRLFLAGDIDGAIRVMDSVDLKGGFEHDAALKERASAIIAEKQAAIDTADERTRQRVEQTILSARMHKLQYRFQEADSLYAMALQYNPDTTNLEIHLEYARFLYGQNQFGQARDLYTELLGRYRLLARKNPDPYLPDVAMTLNNLGNLLYYIGDFAGAREDYEEALKIRRELARKNPDAYLPDVAMTLNNLGNLHSVIGDFAGARKDLEEALKIRRELSRKNPDAYVADVAATLNNLGVLLLKTGDLAGAREDYAEALKIYRELACNNPDAHLPYVAMTLNNLGVLLYDIGDFAGAREDYSEALEIRRELARKNPDAYLPYVAMTLNNLGLLTIIEGDPLQAVPQLGEALEIRGQLFRKNPTADGDDAGETALALARAHHALLDTTGDLRHRTQGLDLLAKARDFLAVYQEPVIPKILQLRREIDSLSQEFQSYDPEDRAIRERLRPLSAAVEPAQSPHEKVLRQEALLRELEAMRTQYPQNGSLTTLIAKAYGDLAWHHLLDQDFPAAEAAARKGFQLAPEEAWIQARLATALLFQGKWDEARETCLRLKNQPQGNATPAKAFLKDLDALEKAGITHPDVPKARQLLR